MKKWITALCTAALFLARLGGETHEWTNTRGQAIQAVFVSATNKTVTISMQGKTFVLQLAELSPQSQALARKLGDPNSKTTGHSVHAEQHEWTSLDGQAIKALFISGTNEAVTISMQGKAFVVQLADLSPQSRALAAKLRAQQSTAQEPAAVAEAPKAMVDHDQLERRDGLMHFKGKPFTGVAVWKYGNGQKEQERTFKDGKREGTETWWHKNGKKKDESNFKDGREDGLSTAWHENGQKKWETTFKDGKRDGLSTWWHDNGQKRGETTYRDGNQDGLWTWWHENGQKERETTHKDGELISEKRWDEEGNPK